MDVKKDGILIPMEIDGKDKNGQDCHESYGLFDMICINEQNYFILCNIDEEGKYLASPDEKETDITVIVAKKVEENGEEVLVLMRDDCYETERNFVYEAFLKKYPQYAC